MSHAISLNDNWIFTTTDDSAYQLKPITEGHMVSLPHTWNQTDGQGGADSYFRGSCWYQKGLIVSPEDLTKHIYLEIGAAGNIGHVYVNGRLAGESRCGYAMFRVLLTPYLKEGENLIAIQVDNRQHNEVFPLMADFTFYGGLYREVKLFYMDDIHFEMTDNGRDGIYLTPKKLEGRTFELLVEGQVANRSAMPEKGEIRVRLQDQDGITVLEDVMQLAFEDQTKFAMRSELIDPILWEGVVRPYLYSATIEVIVGGRIRDSRNISVGFRTIEVTTDRGFLLNGKPVKLNGVCRHQDFGGRGNAITKEHMELDMSLIREIGANSLRLAHYQHDDYFYSLCDRYGLLVWAEIPFISIPSAQDPESRNAEEQLEKLIKQAYNHCSIYCWGVQNEITIAVENEHTHRSIQKLVRYARALDPNRLTAQANIYSVENESVINRYTDLVGYNLYYGWYYGEIKDLADRFDAFHQAQPDVPLILSEYGVDTNPKYHSYTPQVQDYTEEYQLLFHRNAIEAMSSRLFVQGGYVWNMFDFGSANRREGGETGKNQKGLVTIDRALKKDAFYLYKAYWSKEPFVHLAGRRFVNRHQELNDIVILSNLRRVRVYLNGILLTEISNEEPVKIVKDVSLAIGEHLLQVEATDELSHVYRDEIQLCRVMEIDSSYIHVKKEESGNVVNWFEKFDLSNAESIELKEGYYSTFDTFDEYDGNEEAKRVFLKYFGDMTNNPFFEVTKNVMSIEKFAQITNIPPELLAVINRELNVIKKVT
ncbi:beta-galactosidase [Paenibacillus sp. BK033]|uniref:glycoside hydrolase family 2 protein n=1 Tax=Paenibacillus sp. BK033 TaxID=2512133 RepID=UPI0010477721|nr:glycoside hydrolase family 2 TIM barrel-domain containing protein [Paenibacillus sp. BK033]TCM97773.1 beta-galactosidase [Paenibacillus sp. BK033]